MPTLRYHVVDVFADGPFSGNPLAVVLDGESLTDDEMQSLAREFNLSETAFPLRPSDDELADGIDYRLRVFTPLAELPFAGHPSVGAAWVLASLGRLKPGGVLMSCAVGVLPMSVERGPGRVELTGGQPRLRADLDVDAALAACGLASSDLVTARAPVAGTGIDYGYLFVRGAALAAAIPNLAAVRALGAGGAGAGLVLVDWDDATATARARVFVGDIGAPEDPATGSAALGLGAVLVADGRLASDGESTYTVFQGAEMGRPSRMDCAVVANRSTAVECRVSGNVVSIACGEIVRPHYVEETA
jgi:trans-2,3-dihydro-3-hydroxyanthranilate isomerase